MQRHKSWFAMAPLGLGELDSPLGRRKVLCAFQDQSEEENTQSHPTVSIPWPILKSLLLKEIGCLSGKEAVTPWHLS